MEQRSKGWFKQRQRRVTASSAGAILGLSPFTKRIDVMRRMVRDYHGAPSEFTGNQATEWGVLNEPGAIKQYEMMTNQTVTPCGFYEYEDWLGASPDGLLEGAGLIEVKCPFGLRKKNPPNFKPIKEMLHYYAQMQVQLHVTGLFWGHFYQWAPFGDVKETVFHDKPFSDMALSALKKFYDEYLIERELPNAEKYLDGQEKLVQKTQE